jgi:DNA-binding SARP family transcriptional activator
MPGFPHQQSFLLLCYLLLQRRHPQHREKLADLFWSHYRTAIARKHLRNALWRMRGQLARLDIPVDRYLSMHDECISFTPLDDFWLDVEAFEKVAQRYRHIDGRELSRAQAAELERAVQHYTGDLLEGVMEDWCIVERERLSMLHLNALHKLMVHLSLEGHYEKGLSIGQRILQVDATREKVHRHLMRLYWFLGDRAAAIQQYQRCESLLWESLAVQPMPETRELYHRILTHTGPAPLPHPRRTRSLDERQALQDLARRALAKLERLRRLVEDSNAEILELEQWLSQALGAHLLDLGKTVERPTNRPADRSPNSRE